MSGYFRFSLQRRLRKIRREWRLVTSTVISYSNLHIWSKWRQLGIIRRLILLWWGAIGFFVISSFAQLGHLRSFYEVSRPYPGGQWSEALVGDVKLINPIFPDTAAQSEVSKLVFNGLTKYNDKRELVPDLASGWEVSSDGRIYTFKLRGGVKWHNGAALKAGDVVSTILALQNPDTRSPLSGSWQGVKVRAEGDNTVIFELPNSFPPFIHSTTVGILPESVLKTNDPARLRALDFNQKPIGTGPFKVKSFIPQTAQIHMEANSDYFLGKPKLDQFVVRLYGSYLEAADAYAKKQVNAVGDIALNQAGKDSAITDIRLVSYHLPQQTGLFFKNSSSVVAEKSVRQALSKGINRTEIIESALDGKGLLVNSVLLPGQLGYTNKHRQAGYDYEAAAKQLSEAGWNLGEGGKRFKDGQPLKLQVVTGTSSEYREVAKILAKQWGKLGVTLDIKYVSSHDLQQSYIRPRQYDVLLYGINIGVDPDVYVYWHSSQVSDPGLNLSQYKSSVADRALESGRVNPDVEIRAGKYQVFAATWNEDTPAIMLYTPDYLYGVAAGAHGPTSAKLVEPADRFYNVHEWTVKTTTTRRR